MKFNVLIFVCLASALATSAMADSGTSSDNMNSFLIDTSNQNKMAAICRIGAYASKTPKDNPKSPKTGGNGIEFAFRYKPIPFIATEAGIGYYYIGKDGFYEGGDSKAYALPLTATVKGILPFIFGNLYVSGGIGEYFGSKDSSLGFHYGGGFEIFMKYGTMLLIDYKHMQVNDKISGYDFGGDMYNAGFGYRF